MQELIKIITIHLIDKLSSTELLILSMFVVVFGAIFGTTVFAISRGVTDIFGKKFFNYKNK